MIKRVNRSAENTNHAPAKENNADMTNTAASEVAETSSESSTSSSTSSGPAVRGNTGLKVFTIYGRTCGVDFSADSLGLRGRNAAGNEKDMEGKFVLNFFNMENGKQTALVPVYFGAFEWLDFCKEVLSGNLEEVVAEMQSNGEESSIKDWYTGSTTGRFRVNGQRFGDGQVKSVIASIRPGRKEGHVLFNVEVKPGVKQSTGMITPAKGSKAEIRVSVPASLEVLRRACAGCETVINGYYAALMAARLGGLS